VFETKTSSFDKLRMRFFERGVLPVD